MPQITITTTFPAPRAVVTPRLLTVLLGYAEGDDFTLTVDLGIAHIAMSVPVSLELGAGRSADAIPFALAAREHTDWFPGFRGELRCEDDGPLASRLRLVGDYDVPLGALGTIVNRRVLRSAAQRSLHRFVERVRADVTLEVRRSELNIRDAAAARS